MGDIRLDGVDEPKIQDSTDATVRLISIGAVQQRNLIVRDGNRNHRRYTPKLIGLVAAGTTDPTNFITQEEPVTDAYEVFDRREPGWLKVELQPDARANEGRWIPIRGRGA